MIQAKEEASAELIKVMSISQQVSKKLLPPAHLPSSRIFLPT